MSGSPWPWPARCTHRWEEVGRTFTEDGITRAARQGATDLKSGSFLSQEAMDRWLHGFTNVELRCVHCGDIVHRQVLGKAEAPRA